MKWVGRRGSTNVDDRRGMTGGRLIAGGGVVGVIFLIVNYLITGDTSQIEQQLNQGNQAPMSSEQQAAQDSLAMFSSVVLADCEDVWNKIFADNGGNYREPVMVLFSGSVQSGCGGASSQMGPFYCPSDSRVYLDLSFFDELRTRFGAPGDFAIAYVIAHEVGHHVQNLMGTSDDVHRQQQMSGNEKEANRLSVMLELQADFYAGVWAHHNQEMKNVLEPGDVEEALGAASAVGDDRLQKQSQGQVVPDAFTHGTSEQRMYWFKKGFQTGDIRQGDTFSAPNL